MLHHCLMRSLYFSIRKSLYYHPRVLRAGGWRISFPHLLITQSGKSRESCYSFLGLQSLPSAARTHATSLPTAALAQNKSIGS